MEYPLINGLPILIVPNVKKQRKVHRKKRINKKWAKRYGFICYNYLKDGDIIMTPDGLMMNNVTYETLRIRLAEEKQSETT